VSALPDLLLRDARLPDGRRVDIVCRGGVFGAMTPADGTGGGSVPAPAPAATTYELDGRLVTPGLVDAHVHLDKAFLSARAPGVEGTLAEAIRVTGEAKKRFTVDDIRARARQVLDLAVRSGTTAMRGHVEVDPIVGLMALEAVLPLKAEYAPALDLQVCAFAQEGILRSPGTEALLTRALRGGADLVGGCRTMTPTPAPTWTSCSAWPRSSGWTRTFTRTSSTNPRISTSVTSASRRRASGGRDAWSSAT